MASFPKVATDFDQIIQADRQRRKNEELAKEIFGRNKQKDNKRKDDKRPGRISTPSLASRVGIAKRSSSTSSNTPSPRFQPRPSRTSLPTQTARANRIAHEINNDTSANLNRTQSSPQPTTTINTTTSIAGNTGISIKGASGPFVLHASNFAPGTTAADIESALHPDTLYSNGISSLVSCKLVSTKPDVVAELVFTEKVVAESIISKYNGQKADGRILRVELIRSGVGSMSKTHVQPAVQSPKQSQLERPERRDNRHPKQHQQLRHQPEPAIQDPEPDFSPDPEIITDDTAMIMEDVEMDPEDTTTVNTAATNFDDEREAADRDRRDRDSRRDRDELYDDSKKRGGGDDDRRRNDRNRGHERDRDRDRERDTGRDSHNHTHREYERRETRPREERRGTMASHYGNGVGGGPRGAFGGPGGGIGGGGYGGGPQASYRGGRYGDGYGTGAGAGAGGRGGYRGGYRGYR